VLLGIFYCNAQTIPSQVKVAGCYDTRFNRPSDNLYCNYPMLHGCCFYCTDQYNQNICGSLYQLGYDHCDLYNEQEIFRAVVNVTACRDTITCNCPGGKNLVENSSVIVKNDSMGKFDGLKSLLFNTIFIGMALLFAIK
jgi:hypothetical protein